MSTAAEGLTGGISERVGRGVFWMTAAGVSARVLGLFSAIFLTRLLEPSDFGIVAAAGAVIGFTKATTATGFDSAIVQRQEDPAEFLNTAWTIEIGRYLLLFFVLFASAPLAAMLLGSTESGAVMRVLSLTLLLQGFNNIGMVCLTRELDFKKIFIWRTAPLLAGSLSVVALALILKSLWALVWAELIQALCACALSYALHPYRPRPELAWRRARELFGFGKWVFGTSIIAAVRQQGVSLFTGHLFGVAALGIFNRASSFSTRIFDQFVEMVWRIGYPAYSMLQKRPESFRKAYVETLTLVAFLGIPACAGLIILSSDFVDVVLTGKWSEAAPVMQILSATAALHILSAPASVVFQAAGSPELNAKLSMRGFVILAALIYPLASYAGLPGIAFALFLSTLAIAPSSFFMAARIAGCGMLDFVKPIGVPVAGSALMALLVLFLKSRMGPLDLPGLLLFVVAGAAFYLPACYGLDRLTGAGVFRLFFERLSAMRPR